MPARSRSPRFFIRVTVAPFMVAYRGHGKTSMIPHDKLFTPGPVEVSAKTLAAFARPTIGHRGDDFKNLYRDIHSNLQLLFGTKQPVFLSTSSSWGVMEGAIRNLVVKGVLCCMCGAFNIE